MLILHFKAKQSRLLLYYQLFVSLSVRSSPMHLLRAPSLASQGNHIFSDVVFNMSESQTCVWPQSHEAKID